MLIKENQTEKKVVGPMKISSYKINPDFSGTLIELDGKHGKIKCLVEDRIYFIIEGKGKFWVGKEEYEVSKNDLVFVPKNTPYDMEGQMKYFLLCSPEFKAREDVFLE